MGYGPESNHFVVELTYNYGIKSYELGNDFLGITIQSKEIIERAKKNDWAFEESQGRFVIEAPGGYKYNIINEPQSENKDPVKKLTLASSNLEKTIAYWNGILGLKILNKAKDIVSLAFDDNQCHLEFKDIGREVNHAKGYGRVAFEVPKACLPDIQKKIEDTRNTVLTPLISLDTPGKATVSVVILADPVSKVTYFGENIRDRILMSFNFQDKHEICFVDKEGFGELSAVDPKADAELTKHIKADKS